jgi:hypothetical protein
LRNQDDDLLILGCEELQKIFDVYHQVDSNDFNMSTTILREKKNSQIPVLKVRSGFFKVYDDSVYESVLEEIQNNFKKLTQEDKKWHFKRASKL